LKDASDGHPPIYGLCKWLLIMPQAGLRFSKAPCADSLMLFLQHLSMKLLTCKISSSHEQRKVISLKITLWLTHAAFRH